jgi:lysyl oxidase-like protein 2/3/4
MDNIRCGGHELEISECRFDSWGENDCDPSEAAGVICSSPEVKKPKNTFAINRSDVAVAKKTKKHKIKVNHRKSYTY